MNKFLTLFILFYLLIWPACKGKSETSPTVEVIEGVEHVHNPALPLHPEMTVVFAEELTIGEEDEAGNIQLYRPGRYAIDSSGNIFISDRQELVIKIFTPDGKIIRTIGAKGSGPGEFQGIGEMAILPDGRLLVLDWELRRTSIFSADSKFFSSHKWRILHFDLFLVADSTYTTDDIIFGEKPQIFIKTYDFKGEERLSYGEFTAFEMKMVKRGEGLFSISLPYEPLSIFTGNQLQQWLYHCLNNQYVIEVYDREGKLFRKIDRPYQPVLFTQEDAEEYYAGFDDEDNKVYGEIAREVDLPKYKTITERMLSDDRENLWVETFEEKTQEDRTLLAYDIFDKNGFYIARIWSHLRPGRFLNGKMYHMLTDEETGSRTFKRYQVIWKE